MSDQVCTPTLMVRLTETVFPEVWVPLIREGDPAAGPQSGLDARQVDEASPLSSPVLPGHREWGGPPAA